MASNPSITVTAIQTPIIVAHSHANRLAGEGLPPLNAAWSHQVSSALADHLTADEGSVPMLMATGTDLGVFHPSTLGLQGQSVLVFSLITNWVHQWVSKLTSPKEI